MMILKFPRVRGQRNSIKVDSMMRMLMTRISLTTLGLMNIWRELGPRESSWNPRMIFLGS